MQSITNREAPKTLDGITRAHHLPSTFREDTFIHRGELRFTIQGFDADRRRVHFTVTKDGLPAAHNMRGISVDEDGEYFTFLNVKCHARQFRTWDEHKAVMEDFFTHYRISDSRTPHLRHVGGRGGQAMFEDALVMSGLPYGDNVDA